MNRFLLLISAAAAMLLAGCGKSDVKIAGRFVGTDDATVYLEQVFANRQELLDSARLEADGSYRFHIGKVSATPSLYNIVYNGERIPLFLAAGDRLTVQAAGNVVRTYTVEGSAESELLRTFYQRFIAGAQQLDGIAKQLAAPSLTEERQQELVREYTQAYYRIRREQLAFISENKASLAAVYALYQRLPGDTQLSDAVGDIIHYRSVAEAIEARYPASPYLLTLKGDITRMEASQRLLQQITESTFPDLELPDMYGKKIKLSSLEGKVILLDYWSAELGNSNTLNAELKELYAQYHHAATPLEVYQVAIDTSKPLWISTVQEQALPWISVSDLRGQLSPALGTYNVTKLPTNFLIDKTGTIVGRDLRGDALKRELDRLTR